VRAVSHWAPLEVRAQVITAIIVLTFPVFIIIRGVHGEEIVIVNAAWWIEITAVDVLVVITIMSSEVNSAPLLACVVVGAVQFVTEVNIIVCPIARVVLAIPVGVGGVVRALFIMLFEIIKASIGTVSKDLFASREVPIVPIVHLVGG
jgi:hypothetical protein